MPVVEISWPQSRRSAFSAGGSKVEGHLAQRMHLGRKLVSKCHNLPKPVEKGFCARNGDYEVIMDTYAWALAFSLTFSQQMEINEMRGEVTWAPWTVIQRELIKMQISICQLKGRKQTWGEKVDKNKRIGRMAL